MIQKEKIMANLYNLETELEELKKTVWNLTRKVIPALESRIASLEATKSNANQ